MKDEYFVVDFGSASISRSDYIKIVISRKKIINACKLWVKEASGWTKEEIKI